MCRDNIFRICLVLSISLHAGLMLPWSFLNFFAIRNTGYQNIELTYFSGTKTLEARVNELENVYAKKASPEPVKSNTHDVELKPKAEVRTPGEDKMDKEEAVSITEAKTAPQEQKVEVVDIGTQKGAVYEKYYSRIREKIRLAVEKNKRNALKESEVCARFIIDRNGALKSLAFYKRSGIDVGEWERLVAKSIKEAAPFPSFAEKIKESELTINVSIKYQITAPRHRY